MTVPGLPLQATEAFEGLEAAWYEANAIPADEAGQELAHKLAQAMFAAGVEWAANQAEEVSATYRQSGRLLPFANELRGG